MIASAIKQKARELGFDACGIAPVGDFPELTFFRNWLDRGYAGDMAYLHRSAEKRADVRNVLPAAHSVIVTATNYHTDRPYSIESADPSRAQIARYAWGDDYHDVIAAKLEKIDEFLRSFGGGQKSYVDTGPVLERDHAAQAGIGWHGKSTMLIDRKLGTWFFLAEILTTLEFAPDPPQKNYCGRCTRCIDACPTGAITAPHQVDARRCISYLTIELKGPIPIELRPMIGDRIYGCDDCLDACPWNRFAKVSRETAFAMRPEIAQMKLRDYLSLDDDKFRRLFRNSPIKRTKRRGFLRNVCVALGNVGMVEDLPALEKAASDPEPLIAEHAEWALEQIRGRVVA